MVLLSDKGKMMRDYIKRVLACFAGANTVYLFVGLLTYDEKNNILIWEQMIIYSVGYIILAIIIGFIKFRKK